MRERHRITLGDLESVAATVRGECAAIVRGEQSIRARFEKLSVDIAANSAAEIDEPINETRDRQMSGAACSKRHPGSGKTSSPAPCCSMVSPCRMLSARLASRY